MAFEMERRFSAPIDAVWRAWTEADLFSKWYGPMPDPCDVLELDVREGGVYRIAMGGHVDEGTFQTVETPTRLVMNGSQGSMDMRFQEDGVGTRLTLAMPGLPEGHQEGVRGAWTAAFGKLDALL